MTKILNEKEAKGGLSLLFGGSPKVEEEENTSTIKRVDKTLSKEELLETFSPELKEKLENEIKRRKYLKAGRPPKGEEKQEKEFIRMTFLIKPDKQKKLREIALREGLFMRELLDSAIDVIIKEYEEK